MSDTPNPGSHAAQALGCICPVIDNAHGKGWKGGAKNKDGETMFVQVVGCPVHDATRPRDEANQETPQ